MPGLGLNANAAAWTPGAPVPATVVVPEESPVEDAEEEWERVEVAAVEESPRAKDAGEEDDEQQPPAAEEEEKRTAEANAAEELRILEEEMRRRQQSSVALLDAEGTWGDDDDDDEPEPERLPDDDKAERREVVEEPSPPLHSQEPREERSSFRPAPYSTSSRGGGGGGESRYARQDEYGRRPGGFSSSSREGGRYGGGYASRDGFNNSRGRSYRRDEDDEDSRPPRRSNSGSNLQQQHGNGLSEPPKPKEYQKPAWAKVGDETSDAVVLKKAKSILNKLTLEKFDRLSEEFVNLDLNSVELVAGAIDLIVDKAQRETHFVDIYAELCVKLAATPLAGLGEVEKGKKFRRLLLERCQAEFERDNDALVVEIEAISDEAERQARITSLRKVYIGHMFFIGALYKQELLRETIMHHCVQELFGDPDEPDDEKIECLAKLMTTIGKQLDAAALEKKESQKFMKAYFKQLKKLSKSDKLETRIRFLVRDLCELRENDWKPRRVVEQAKTIAEIHEDIKREEDVKAGKKPSTKKDGKGGASGSSKEGKAGNKVADDGWETVGTAKSVPAAMKPARNAVRAPDPAPVSSSAFGAFASLSTSSKSDKKKKKKKEEKPDKTTSKSSSSSSSSSKKDKGASSSSSDNKADHKPPPRSTPSPPAAPSFDEVAYKAKAKAAIDEYVAIQELDEVVACVTAELDTLAGSRSARYLVATQALDIMLNCKERDRGKLGPLLVELAKRDVLDAGALTKAFLELLEFLPDIAIDQPKAKDWLGDVLKTLVHANALTLDFLSAAPPPGIVDGGDEALGVWNAFKSYVDAK
ncbi:hypothetical protein CTAYLR_005467 [Chrysophaeum taylorii]|uniref:MI domain-containing protein n=1 Tax=Chrysophaeum taylorii TaxID=2483200 RepID=A0AAD7UKG1_9STRA|nr:hypothetical protein CTAYLR_005467 [Chrysophaeum taylorii]